MQRSCGWKDCGLFRETEIGQNDYTVQVQASGKRNGVMVVSERPGHAEVNGPLWAGP